MMKDPFNLSFVELEKDFRVQSIRTIALILLGVIGCLAYAFRARTEQSGLFIDRKFSI